MAHRPYPDADRARRQITRHVDETGPVGDQSRSLPPLTLKLTAEVSAGPQVFGSSLAKMLTPARQAPPVDEPLVMIAREHDWRERPGRSWRRTTPCARRTPR
ncbi:hypothetical protein [Streptomyces mirabilis]|uniref:hypothetical protein n=1 Tax=Streptomyces mirabilis TaxID=68239 RepID=UPI0033AC56C8